MGAIEIRNRTPARLLLFLHAATTVPGRVRLPRLGCEPLRRALVCLRPSGPGSVALDSGGSQVGRTNVGLLDQLRQVRGSQWSTAAPMAGVHRYRQQGPLSR